MIDSYTRWQAVNVDLSGKLQEAQIDLSDAEALRSPDYSDVIR